MIPAYDLELMRSAPQCSDLYLIIQQPERFTEGEYLTWRNWADYLWSCRIAVEPTTDPTATLAVNTGSAPNRNLLDGMTVFIGSAYGEWDKAIVRLRGDQVCGAATIVLNIATSSDVRGKVKVGDYVVVLDEFRLWQRYGRITAAAGVVTWYKDYDLTWAALGANDAARRLAMMPPVPIMGTHAVKFVDPPGHTANFWWDWSNSYAAAPGAAMATWNSWGIRDWAGNTWNSVAIVPGWQPVDFMTGLHGFRVWLEVNDASGNAATLPYRRGVRYVFTLRRPGQSQPGDPPNVEPITEFRLNGAVEGSFNDGYWRTSVTLYGDAANKYAVIPGALIILFTEDWHTADAPYLAPRGLRRVSVGPLYDRENILMVGRIADGSIVKNPETQTVTFEVISTGEESSMRDNPGIVINDNDASTDWINTGTLTVDRAIRYYVAWHTTMSLIADVYQTGDTHEIMAQDFESGPIYSTLDSFLKDRLFARLLFDKYGRAFCEIDQQMRMFGSVPTQWVLSDRDWVGELNIKHYESTRTRAAECGGIIYFGGDITPKLSRSPGSYDAYHGSNVPTANALAITDQIELNVLAGRLFEYENREWEIGMRLGGDWRYLDITRQSAVYVNNLDAERGDITGRLIIRRVSFDHHPEQGYISTDIETENETNDGTPGVTVPIPAELPVIPKPKDGMPRKPWQPGVGEDTGRRILATDMGVMVCNNIEATSPYWYAVNAGFITANDRYVYTIARDPHHWWTSETERTLWAVTRTGIWKHENFPVGTWVCQITYAQLMAFMGYSDATHACPWLAKGRINLSIETEGRYAVICNLPDKLGGPDRWWERTTVFVCQAAAIVNGTELCADGQMACCGSDAWTGWGDVIYAPHHGAQHIYATSARTWDNAGFAEMRCWKTINGGGAWVTIDGPRTFWQGSGEYTSLALPYIDAANPDKYVFWMAGAQPGVLNTARQSSDQGATFSNIDALIGVQAYDQIREGFTQNRIYGQGCRIEAAAGRWTGNGGLTWADLPLYGLGFFATYAFDLWDGDTLRSVLVGGYPAGGPPATGVYLVYWRNGVAAWINKTGNLNATHGVNYVWRIDRDSRGAA